jgi:hypothetical protein
LFGGLMLDKGNPTIFKTAPKETKFDASILKDIERVQD